MLYLQVNNYTTRNHFHFLVHVIIATPGRIYDLIKKELANTKDCQMAVMDEVLYMYSCIGLSEYLVRLICLRKHCVNDKHKWL